MNITTVNLGWIILGWLLAGTACSGIGGWLAGQYKVTRQGRRLCVTRRWYGARAHVCLRGEADGAQRYSVTRWYGEGTALPWLLVQNIDDEDEPDAFWAPVTDFAPYSVRRLRPHILRTGHYRFPQVFDYRPLRQPSGFLGDARDAA